MFRTWSFWKTFFTAYLALVAGIWGFVEAYTYFESDSLKQLLGSNWWIYYYLLPLFIAVSVATLTNAKLETQAETLDQHNLRVMLDHVENFWVKGILEKSLHGAALLELGIKEDQSAVNYPWAIKKESTNETLPPGKSMLEIFQEIGMGRSLLILGAPGSGKTTMLLELTRQLIERARQDETEPIPVVFNLASWKEKQALADWLAEQLNIVYYVPKKIAPTWVNENRMLLLLDGLDEAKVDSRAKCVEAINQFRTEHGLISLVVTSRIEEYSTLNTKLSFDGAITLQPFTSKQINAYFDRLGKSLAIVKQLLKKDEALQELAETPLMLSIMALAYKNIKAEELLALDQVKDQRKHLFNTYIDRMFKRSNRSSSAVFTKPETLHYLSWLAGTMLRHNLITYQIESMQPSWLEKQPDIRLYQQLFIMLLVVLFSGLLGGLLGGLLIGLLGKRLGGQENTIEMSDRLTWSWKVARRWLILHLISVLLFGLLLGLLGGLSSGGLVFGLSAGLIGGLLGGLGSGLISNQVEETTYPGQRLKQTFFNGLATTLSVMLIFGLLLGLSAGLIGRPIFGLRVGLIFGLSFGLMLGLFKEYEALIQHYVLRWLLVQRHSLPRQLILFLEYAVGLIFLRRVGGSYIFVHRLLMEHFAEMDA